MEPKSPQLQVILAVSAHAADFCSRSGGTIALHTRRGDTVHVIGLTFGERGESEGYWARNGDKSVSEAREIRRAEASRAAAVLGAGIEFFDFGDYPLVLDRPRIDRIASRIRALRPDTIVTHWNRDPYNVDHEVAANAVLRAASIAAIAGFEPETQPSFYPAIFAFEPTIPRNDDTGFKPSHYVPIDEVFDVKMQALRCFECQSRLTGMYTQWGEYRGTQARQWSAAPVKYAEAFQRYTASVGTELR